MSAALLPQMAPSASTEPPALMARDPTSRVGKPFPAGDAQKNCDLLIHTDLIDIFPALQLC